MIDVAPESPIADYAAACDVVRSTPWEEHDEASFIPYSARLLNDDWDNERAWLWVFGLLLTAKHVSMWPAYAHSTGLHARKVLQSADRVFGSRPCAHDVHPYESGLNEDLERLASYLPLLGNGLPTGQDLHWSHSASKEAWLCPRNLAGCAREAVSILTPRR
ncbi:MULTISPECIES: hypothetical protein [Streptomyces]|jgi:hypothetical protein|uniref:Uncharacterized protein n=1 Tax=Streptomyces sp. 900129855 TaxID=3155129 RepID=A0ABV2ZJW1_9ACTN